MGTRVPVEGAYSLQRLGLGWKPPGGGAVQSGRVPRPGLPLPHSIQSRGPVRQQQSPRECSQRGLPGGQHVFLVKSGVVRLALRRGSGANGVLTVRNLPLGLTSSPQYSQSVRVSMKSSVIISPSIVMTDSCTSITPNGRYAEFSVSRTHSFAWRNSRLRCWIHCGIGICGPLFVRTICQDMVSCFFRSFRRCDRAPPFRGDGCSPDGGPPGRRKGAQGRAATVAWAQSMGMGGLCAIGLRFLAERAAHGPPYCDSSWFPRGWQPSPASRCCVLCLSLCLRSLWHIWQQQSEPIRGGVAFGGASNGVRRQYPRPLVGVAGLGILHRLLLE